MLSYICVGLGVFLSIYSINLANPEADLGFFEGIIAFLMTIFAWPLTLIANGMNAWAVRQERTMMNEMFQELMSKASTVEISNEPPSLTPKVEHVCIACTDTTDQGTHREHTCKPQFDGETHSEGDYREEG